MKLKREMSLVHMTHQPQPSSSNYVSLETTSHNLCSLAKTLPWQRLGMAKHFFSPPLSQYLRKIILAGEEPSEDCHVVIGEGVKTWGKS